MKRLSATHLLVAATLCFGLAGQSLAYQLPVDLAKTSNSKVLMGDQLDGDLPALNTAQKKALAKNGFVITPAKNHYFDHAYETVRYANVPSFITTDSMLHTYHLIFGKLLRDLERQQLTEALKQMTSLLLVDADKMATSYKNTPLASSAYDALAYLAVANRLIDPQATIPSEVASRVKAELAQIEAHEGVRESQILKGYREDYSQYLPRGHYSRSDTFKRYFRTMMWLGRINFAADNAGSTQTAAILSQLLSNNLKASQAWAKIYEPTSLLVGKSDDLNYRDYSKILARVADGDAGNLEAANTLAAFQQAVKKMPKPKINSIALKPKPGESREDREEQTVGFRLMGQRFVVDSEVLQRFVMREVEGRQLPKGLDLLAALGSNAALNELRRMGESKYTNYNQQMKLVRANLSALPASVWNETVYSGWIYTLAALAKPEARDERYPAFMKTPAWTRKELLTALGSWTELRHDTILYAKQVTAEMGAGDEDSEYPKSYVEPNLAVWNRLLNLESMTRAVLKKQNLINVKNTEMLDELKDTLVLLEKISRKQLAGEKISKDEYAQLFFYGGSLESMRMASADSEDEYAQEFNENSMAALVADVASSPAGVLNEATGYINTIYTVVPDGKGGIQVAIGGVYSQYEWVGNDRMTDEAWKKRVRSGNTPAEHTWLKGILVK